MPFWSLIDAATTIISCVVTMFYGFPAYKRTKQVGFVYWGAGALGSLGNTLALHLSDSSDRSNPAMYHFFHQSYRVMFVFNAGLGTIGTILVINGYLRLFEDKHREPPPLPGQV